MTNEEWIKAMRAGIPEEGEFPISSYDDLHPGRFLKCGHLNGEPRTLTVTGFTGQKMGMKNGKAQIQGIMSFREIDKQYATQKTNEKLLVAMFGAEPSAVIGKRVTFRPGRTLKGRDMVDAIRIAGSPDMTEKEIVHTVEYVTPAGKPPRKPETFTLTKTKMAGEAKQEAPPAEPTKPPGDLTKALALISIWVGTDAELRTKLEQDSWAKPERLAIKKALDERAAAKAAPRTVDVGERS